MLTNTGWIYGLSATITLLFGVCFGVYLIREGQKSELKILKVYGLFVLFSGFTFLGNTLDFFTIIFTGKNLDFGLNIVGILGNIWIAPVVVTGLYIAIKLIMTKPNWYILGIFLILLIIYEFLIIFDPFNSLYYEIPESSNNLIRVRVAQDSFIQILTLLFLFTEFIFFVIGFFIKALNTEGIIRKKFSLLSFGFLLITISAIFEPIVPSDALFVTFRFLFLCGFILWYFALREEQEKVKESAIKIEESLFRISKSKELEDEMQKIKQLKSELLNRASHELKTPLISIKGFSNLILELHHDKIDDDLKRIINEIKKGAEKLETIVNTLIEGKSLEIEHYNIELSRQDISELIENCVKEYESAIKTRNHELILDIPEVLEIAVDKKKIQEIINNLLSNAIKYTPLGGTIKIEAKNLENIILISVTDNGIGFTKTEKEQIFQKFGKIERYGQGWSISPEGMGFGLYISQKFAELLNGRLWMRSDGRNQGSTFYLSLPKRKKNP